MAVAGGGEPGRARDAQIYRRLAAYARRCGYRRVTPYVVQHWVKRGLLPRTGRAYAGFGAPHTTQDVRTGRQLLALCRHRYAERCGRLDALLALLWLDGFEVPSATVGPACRQAFERLTAERKRQFDRAGDLDPEDSPDDARRDFAMAGIANSPLGRSTFPDMPLTERIATAEELGAAVATGEPLSQDAILAVIHATQPAGLTPEDVASMFAQRMGPGVAAELASPNAEVLEVGRTLWLGLGFGQVAPGLFPSRSRPADSPLMAFGALIPWLNRLSAKTRRRIRVTAKFQARKDRREGHRGIIRMK
jgi:hypothetical protein